MHSEENAGNHRCYGYNAFRSKKYCSEIVWYFIGVHILNRSSRGRSEIIVSLFLVEKYYFVSVSGHVTSFIYDIKSRNYSHTAGDRSLQALSYVEP